MTAMATSGTSVPPRATSLGANANPGEFLQVFAAHQTAMLRLCTLLEEIADSLPFNIDVGQCLEAARSLPIVLASAIRFEEDVFWPWAATVLSPNELSGTTIERLHDEHRDDEDFAEELSAILMDWGLASEQRNPETTGYMLRGFFSSLRRHVAYEADLVMRIQNANRDEQT